MVDVRGCSLRIKVEGGDTARRRRAFPHTPLPWRGRGIHPLSCHALRAPVGALGSPVARCVVKHSLPLLWKGVWGQNASIGVWGRLRLHGALGALDVSTHRRNIRTIGTGVHTEGPSTSIDFSLYPITLFFTSVWGYLLSVAYKNTTTKNAAI